MINDIGNRIVKIVIKSNPNNNNIGVPNNNTPTPKSDWIVAVIITVNNTARDMGRTSCVTNKG